MSQQPNHSVADILRGFLRKLCSQQKTRFTASHGKQTRRTGFPGHSIRFPVTSHSAIISFLWPYEAYTHPGDASDAWLVIDLGKATPVGRVILGQGQDNHILGKLWRGYVYVGNEVESLFTDANQIAEYHYETADALPASVSDPGVLMTAETPRSGRYVGIRVPMNGSYWGASAVGFRTSEIGIYAPVSCVEGAQIRQYQSGAATQALRFGSTAQVSGVTYRTVGNNPYYGDLSDATFVLAGNRYPVAEMGTLVARKAVLKDADPHQALRYMADHPGVGRVPAEKLVAVDRDSVTYTAVITDVPASAWDEMLVARSYVRFIISGSEADGTAVYATYYGNVEERSVRQMIDAMNG